MALNSLVSILIFSICLLTVVQSNPTGVGAISAFKIIELARHSVISSGVTLHSDCPAISSVYLGTIGVGAFLLIKGVEFGPGAVSVEFNLSDGNSFGHTGSIYVRLDDVDGPIIATVSTGVTGDRCNFISTNTFLATEPNNTHDVYLTFDSPDTTQPVVNLNWMVFNVTVDQPFDNVSQTIKNNNFIKQLILKSIDLLVNTP